MKFCKKCKKAIKSRKESYNDLCFDCYKEYLLEKIQHIGEDTYIFASKNHILKSISNSIKNFFKRKKSR